MNSRLKVSISVFLYFAFICVVFTQSIEGELIKIRNAYISSPQLSFDVEVYSYASSADKSGELISNGEMKKSNGNYYSRFNNYEMMINEGKTVIVDLVSKTMDYYEYELEKPNNIHDYPLNMDSLFLNTDSIVIRPVLNGLKHFTCFSEDGFIKQTEIYVDQATYLISRIMYYYVESTEDYEIGIDRIDIHYLNIRKSAIEDSVFNFNNYFKKTGSKIQPIGKYGNFHLSFYNSDTE